MGRNNPVLHLDAQIPARVALKKVKRKSSPKSLNSNTSNMPLNSENNEALDMKYDDRKIVKEDKIHVLIQWCACKVLVILNGTCIIMTELL